MNENKISTLQVFDRMVKDDNKGIAMSSTIVNAQKHPKGFVVSFGCEDKLGEDARAQINGLPGEYAICCLFVNRKEIDKTRHLMMEELFEQQEKKNK